jgi:hypothetical protein
MRHVIQSRDNWNPLEVGLYAGLTMQEYLKAPGLSRSDLVRVMDRPSDLADGIQTPSTRAMEFGTLLNDFLLFGWRNYYVRPAEYPSTPKPTKAEPNPVTEMKPWNGNATWCVEWMTKHSDKPILPGEGEHSSAMLNNCAEKVLACPVAVQLIKEAAPEVSIFSAHESHRKLLRCRPDLIKLCEDGSEAPTLRTSRPPATLQPLASSARFSGSSTTSKPPSSAIACSNSASPQSATTSSQSKRASAPA